MSRRIRRKRRSILKSYALRAREIAEIAESVFKENQENPFALAEATPLMPYLCSITCKQAFR